MSTAHSFLPSEAGEVARRVGGVKGSGVDAHDPSARCAGTSPSRSPRRGGKLTLILSVGGILLLLAGANAHLVYVAVTSQPDCVDHVRAGDAEKGSFRAAKSACSPGARS